MPPLVLDGGLGHLLKTRFPDEAISPTGEAVFLGGALLASRRPAAVTAAHTAFIEAGADIITAATFGVVPPSLARAGLSGSDLDPLVRAAVGAARAAADASPRRVTVAASLGPLGECYVPWCVDGEVRRCGVDTYALIARAAVASGADVLFIETAASGADAAAAVTGAAGGAPGVPVWVSWTVDDTCGSVTRGGDGVATAAAAAATAARTANAPPPAVLGVNCADPRAIEAGTTALAGTATGIAAYGNAFASTTGGWLAARGGSEGGGGTVGTASPATVPPGEFGVAARAWLAAGATIVGGCCGAGPQHVAAVRAVVDAWPG